MDSVTCDATLQILALAVSAVTAPSIPCHKQTQITPRNTMFVAQIPHPTLRLNPRYQTAQTTPNIKTVIRLVDVCLAIESPVSVERCSR